MTAARASVAALAALAACAAPPRWQDDVVAALQPARREQRDLVAYFHLPGRDACDRMRAQLGDPAVLGALADGGFLAVGVAGEGRAGLYGAGVGGGDGMGRAVLVADGRCYAARGGPRDP
ncbi:MAG: hypothetical protein ACK533_19400, partial [Planctomycetota bacterium]